MLLCGANSNTHQNSGCQYTVLTNEKYQEALDADEFCSANLMKRYR